MMELNSHQVPLTLSAHLVAEEFSLQQSHPKKAARVYHNTLAVLAVNTYLQCLGWTTSLESSDSWNPVMQTLLDTGDLKIPQYGTIECRPILGDDRVMVIPDEVDPDRIACVAVKIAVSQKYAQLLGFISQTVFSRVYLNNLQNIAELPDFLAEYHSRVLARQQLLPKLSNWLLGAIEAGWQTLDREIFLEANRGLSLAPATANFRTGITSQSLLFFEEMKTSSDRGASRVKIWDLGTKEDRTRIAFIISLLLSDRKEVEVSIKVYPTNENTHLPQGLIIKILDETQHPILQAHTKSTNENVEFFLSGEIGEGFSIQALFDGEIKEESFII